MFNVLSLFDAEGQDKELLKVIGVVLSVGLGIPAIVLVAARFGGGI